MKRNWWFRCLFAAGILLLLYPAAGNIIHRQQQKNAISSYRESLRNQDESQVKDILMRADEYNSMLYQSKGALVDNLNTDILSNENYYNILDQSDGIMGSIEIPKIDVDLPVYHGTDEKILSSGVGHYQGSSLPVGGKNTHCVLTGHRGVPGSSLFTRLDELKKGDLFFLQVMGRTLAYRVSGTDVVEPDDTDVLKIRAGMDLCSLITCTPYGINTHRLVVTGKRVSYKKTEYENIIPGVPSWRERIFSAVPFFVLIGTAVIKIVDWRKKKNVRKEKNRKENVSGASDVRTSSAGSTACIRRRRRRRRKRRSVIRRQR